MSFTIAIDGPAGAGKSTIAKAVARELGFCYLDTGAMYRTCGLKADREGLHPEDEEQIVKLIAQADIEVTFEGEEQHMILDGEDVTSLIRTPAMSRWASNISKIREIRNLMVEKQREIAKTSNIVMDGRDIGTFVLPQATLKIFLTASPDERARRRFEELAQKSSDHPTLEAVKEDLMFRDQQDSQRDYAPLKQAEDAILLDTSGLSIQEVTAAVLTYVEERT